MHIRSQCMYWVSSHMNCTISSAICIAWACYSRAAARSACTCDTAHKWQVYQSSLQCHCNSVLSQLCSHISVLLAVAVFHLASSARMCPERSREGAARSSIVLHSLSHAQVYLLMKSLPSAEMLGLAGKETVLAFSITSSRRIFSWLQPSPKGLLPNSI